MKWYKKFIHVSKMFLPCSTNNGLARQTKLDSTGRNRNAAPLCGDANKMIHEGLGGKFWRAKTRTMTTFSTLSNKNTE